MKENMFVKEKATSRKTVSIILALFLVISFIGFSYKVLSGRDFVVTPILDSSVRPITIEKTGVVIGLLGDVEPVLLQDGTSLTTLVESPDPGLIEVGVKITGPRASTVKIDDIALISSSGLEFRASELNKVEGGVAFTINASLATEDKLTLIWSEGNVKLVELS